MTWKSRQNTQIYYFLSRGAVSSWGKFCSSGHSEIKSRFLCIMFCFPASYIQRQKSFLHREGITEFSVVFFWRCAWIAKIAESLSGDLRITPNWSTLHFMVKSWSFKSQHVCPFVFHNLEKTERWRGTFIIINHYILKMEQHLTVVWRAAAWELEYNGILSQF